MVAIGDYGEAICYMLLELTTRSRKSESSMHDFFYASAASLGVSPTGKG
jgi:hypothetical protein